MQLLYSELLQSNEWQSKRLEILDRDNFTCQRCGANPDLQLPVKGLETTGKELKKLFPKISFSKSPYLNTGYVIFKNKNGRLVCKTVIETIEDLKSYAIIIQFKNCKSSESFGRLGAQILITFNKDNAILNYELESLKIPNQNLVLDFEGIWLVSKDEVDEFVKENKILHVHHRCYRMGTEIWAQPDGDYVTLCNICHKIVHEEHKIPFYNRKGKLDHNLKPCNKCGGARYFECYKHIQNGVCFKCNGRGLLKD